MLHKLNGADGQKTATISSPLSHASSYAMIALCCQIHGSSSSSSFAETSAHTREELCQHLEVAHSKKNGEKKSFTST